MDQFFDVVTCWASLEHLYDPGKAIRMCGDMLGKNGIVMILVPNARSLEEKLLKRFGPNPIDVPRHLFHFSRKTLTEMLKKKRFYDKGN